MLCEKCHEREATYHTTYIILGVTKKSDLCSECFESFGPPLSKRLVRSLRDARCQFCGAPATSCTLDNLALYTGEQRTIHFCFACSEEYYNYAILSCKRMTEDLREQDQSAKIRQCREDIEQHMKQWVSTRKPPESPGSTSQS